MPDSHPEPPWIRHLLLETQRVSLTKGRKQDSDQPCKLSHQKDFSVHKCEEKERIFEINPGRQWGYFAAITRQQPVGCPRHLVSPRLLQVSSFLLKILKLQHSANVPKPGLSLGKLLGWVFPSVSVILVLVQGSFRVFAFCQNGSTTITTKCPWHFLAHAGQNNCISRIWR